MLRTQHFLDLLKANLHKMLRTPQLVNSQETEHAAHTNTFSIVQKANLQKIHARRGGRPVPELLFEALLALLAFEVCLLDGI